MVETAADTQYLVWEFQTKTDFWNHGQVKIEMPKVSDIGKSFKFQY